MTLTAGLPAALRTAAATHPDATAYEFVLDDGTVQGLTYGELARRSAALAGRLLERTGGPGRPVLILHPPGLGYVVALLACFAARVPAVPA